MMSLSLPLVKLKPINGSWKNGKDALPNSQTQLTVRSRVELNTNGRSHSVLLLNAKREHVKKSKLSSTVPIRWSTKLHVRLKKHLFWKHCLQHVNQP
jgi:hypothetical protein